MKKTNVLRVAFCALVAALAIYLFSSNTADPDLWGHVLFGQRMLALHAVERVDPFSWTAPGHPWINHEVLAEVALGGAHRLLGGSGILLLKLLIGLATFAIALRTGAAPLAWPARSVAWAMGALAAVEISFGFAARPQIFTALALAIELAILRRAADGRTAAALALPLLFAVWINTHGGVLAGWLLLVLAAGAMTVQSLWEWRRTGSEPVNLSPTALALLWSMVTLCTFALALNPWGRELPRWLLQSILWVRPEIDEWNPTLAGWDHAPYFALLLIAAGALLASRRRRCLWEITVLAALAWISFRHVRHTPLFALAALALVPPHAADALDRFRDKVAGLLAATQNPILRRLAPVAFAAAAATILTAAITLRKEHPFTMEVPDSQYPVQAVKFIKDHGLRGNLLVFFDWGEMALWELPDLRVSIDGRLDTCYPRSIIAANWQVYNGTEPAPRVMNINRADVALLRQDLAGTHMLMRTTGWQLVYRDALAAVLVRDPARFSRIDASPWGVSVDASPRLARRHAYPDVPSASVLSARP